MAKVRSRLLKNPAPAAAGPASESPENTTPGAWDLNPAAQELAERFSTIPEPGRSALALLYINHFSLQEIAQILQITPEELPAAIGSARALLQQMDPARQPEAAPVEEEQP